MNDPPWVRVPNVSANLERIADSCGPNRSNIFLTGPRSLVIDLINRQFVGPSEADDRILSIVSSIFLPPAIACPMFSNPTSIIAERFEILAFLASRLFHAADSRSTLFARPAERCASALMRRWASPIFLRFKSCASSSMRSSASFFGSGRVWIAPPVTPRHPRPLLVCFACFSRSLSCFWMSLISDLVDFKASLAWSA